MSGNLSADQRRSLGLTAYTMDIQARQESLKKKMEELNPDNQKQLLQYDPNEPSYNHFGNPTIGNLSNEIRMGVPFGPSGTSYVTDEASSISADTKGEINRSAAVNGYDPLPSGTPSNSAQRFLSVGGQVRQVIHAPKVQIS